MGAEPDDARIPPGPCFAAQLGHYLRMRLQFSEYRSDYGNYLFPYVIWGYPEAHESPADCFREGFLPGNRDMSRYYMCRHTRVDLAKFEHSSENRRIMRKGAGLTSRLIPSSEFDYTPHWRGFCRSYADHRFGKGVMSDERLDSLFNSPVCSHLIHYQHETSGEDVGLVVCFLQKPRAAFYYYAFYDLDLFSKSPGLFMMTTTVQRFQEMGFDHVYLGSCYSRNALYKSQFKGFEFWNGFRWSQNIKELKFMIGRDQENVHQHLLETPEYIESYYPEGINPLP